MRYRNRNLESFIQKDLKEKFVFLSGPRQVGKTALAETLIRGLRGTHYNWDLSEDREQILQKGFLHDKYVVLDEIHKFARWKTFIKGLYDKYRKDLKILVTGSARLDLFQKGGDSLQGRYFLYHLHPFTLGELNGTTLSTPEIQLEPHKVGKGFEELNTFGGFPEPFLRGSVQAHRRWSLLRREQLLEQDVRQLTEIKLISLLEHFYLLLPDRVGSPLSINALREELEVSFNTVKSWLESFERLFVVFQLTPYSRRVTRSLRKEKKLYFWDWSQVKDPGARFENLVASHLLKATTYWRDLGFGDFRLNYLRDRDRREVDFLITHDLKPWLLVEAKSSEARVSDPLVYFCHRLGVPGIQLVNRRNIFDQKGSITVISADQWLGHLP